MQGAWHKLLHNKHMGKPYLGEPREDIHDHNRDSNPPSKSEDKADGSDPASEAEPIKDKGKQQAESSSEDETNRQICYSPVIVQPLREISPLQETNPPSSPLHQQRPNISILPSLATQRSSIVTFKAQQSLSIPTNMAITTTTATTTVQPSVQSTTTGTTTSPTTTADQRVRDRLRAAMQRSGNSTRGGAPGGGAPGGGAPGGGAPGGGAPGGGGAGSVPTATAQGPVPAAAPGDIRTMGTLPQVFTSNRAKAQDFLDEVLGYFHVNRGVAGFKSPMHKVSITLTMIKGSEVARWAHNMGRWIDTLDPVVDDIELIWEQFQTEFTEQFTNSQQQQHTHLDLDNCQMKFPEINQYITKFEDLARLVGYTVGNEETINFFLKGLSQSVLEDVMKPPFAMMYNDIKDRAIQMTKAKQLIEGIHARHNYPST